MVILPLPSAEGSRATLERAEQEHRRAARAQRVAEKEQINELGLCCSAGANFLVTCESTRKSRATLSPGTHHNLYIYT